MQKGHLKTGPHSVAFHPKATNCLTYTAGLLTFPVFHPFPSRNRRDSGFYVANTFPNFRERDYSYGDSSGISPDSLLIFSEPITMQK